MCMSPSLTGNYIFVVVGSAELMSDNVFITLITTPDRQPGSDRLCRGSRTTLSSWTKETIFKTNNRSDVGNCSIHHFRQLLHTIVFSGIQPTIYGRWATTTADSRRWWRAATERMGWGNLWFLLLHFISFQISTTGIDTVDDFSQLSPRFGVVLDTTDEWWLPGQELILHWMWEREREWTTSLPIVLGSFPYIDHIEWYIELTSHLSIAMLCGWSSLFDDKRNFLQKKGRMRIAESTLSTIIREQLSGMTLELKGEIFCECFRNVINCLVSDGLSQRKTYFQMVGRFGTRTKVSGTLLITTRRRRRSQTRDQDRKLAGSVLKVL